MRDRDAQFVGVRIMGVTLGSEMGHANQPTVLILIESHLRAQVRVTSALRLLPLAAWVGSVKSPFHRLRGVNGQRRGDGPSGTYSVWPGATRARVGGQ